MEAALEPQKENEIGTMTRHQKNRNHKTHEPQRVIKVLTIAGTTFPADVRDYYPRYEALQELPS